jgi:hypothetical protein
MKKKTEVKKPATRTEVEIRMFRGRQKKSRDRITFSLDHTLGDNFHMEQIMGTPIAFRTIDHPYPVFVRGHDPNTVILTLKISPKAKKLTREELRKQKREEKARKKLLEQEAKERQKHDEECPCYEEDYYSGVYVLAGEHAAGCNCLGCRLREAGRGEGER